MLERVQNRLASWKGRLLKRAGRVCLAKSVLSSLPVHLMQVLWLPKNICSSIDAAVRRFIWSGRGEGRSFIMVNWNILTTPKKFGGLAIRDTSLANVSLLGKLVWKILKEPQRL